jgi:cation transport ATPase
MAETSILESIGRVGEVFRGRAGSPRATKGEYDASGRKIRRAPAYLQRVGIGREAPNVKYEKHAARFAYTGEIVFTVFASLVIIELFVRNPKVLLTLHSTRAVAMLAVALLTVYNMYRGYVYPEVDIRFYTVELLVLIAINIAALVVTSMRLAEKRQQVDPEGRPVSVGAGDIVPVVFAGGLFLMNASLLAQQFYRYRLGKRETPVASFFTLLMALVLAAASGNTIKGHVKTLRGPSEPHL